MNTLVDTNVLARAAQPGHPMQKLAVDALAALRIQGRILSVVPQVLYEYWVISTRPTNVNGLGKSPALVAAEIATIKADFVFLEDMPAIFPVWERLVTTHAVLGKNAHDARLVAAVLAHGVTELLTFNDQDFARYPMITVRTPAAGLSPPPPTP